MMSYPAPVTYHQGTGSFPGADPGGGGKSAHGSHQANRSAASPRGSARPVSLCAALFLFLGWLLLLIAVATDRWTRDPTRGATGPLQGSGTSTSAHVWTFVLCLAALLTSLGAMVLAAHHGSGMGAPGSQGGGGGVPHATSQASVRAGSQSTSSPSTGAMQVHKFALIAGAAGTAAAVMAATAVSIYARQHHRKIPGSPVSFEWSFDLAIAAAVFLLLGGIAAFLSLALELKAEAALRAARNGDLSASGVKGQASPVVEVFKPHVLAFLAVFILLVALVLAVIAVSTDTWSQVKSFVPPGSGFRSVTDWRSINDGGKATLAFMIICVIVCLPALAIGTLFALGGSRAQGLAATGLTGFACLCCMIAISVYGGEVHKDLPERKRYGFSFHLAVSAFALLFLAFLLFLVTHILRVPVMVRREKQRGAVFVPPPPAPPAHLPPAPPPAPREQPPQPARTPRKRRVPIVVEEEVSYSSESSSSGATTTTSSSSSSSSSEVEQVEQQPQPQQQQQQPVVPMLPMHIVHQQQPQPQPQPSPVYYSQPQPVVVRAVPTPQASYRYIESSSPRRVVVQEPSPATGYIDASPRRGSPQSAGGTRTVVAPAYYADGTPIASSVSRVGGDGDAYVSTGDGYVRTVSPRTVRREEYGTPR